MEKCKLEKKTQKLNLRNWEEEVEPERGKSGKPGEFGILEAGSGMWRRQVSNGRLKIYQRKEVEKMSVPTLSLNFTVNGTEEQSYK